MIDSSWEGKSFPHVLNVPEFDKFGKIDVLFLHPNAKIPTRGREGDIGYDIFSVENISIPSGHFAWVGTGLAMSFPENFWYEVKPRSGFSLSEGILIHPGTIEHTYTGELEIGIRCVFSNPFDVLNISRGQRIAQILWHERINAEYVETDKLPKTERGEQGFGSSGK